MVPLNDHDSHERKKLKRFNSRYFTEFTFRKGLVYSIAIMYVACCTLVVFVEPFVTLPCEKQDTDALPMGFENPGFIEDKCYRQHFLILLWLSPEQCSFGRRIVISLILGAIIGWERRQADRAAGIRTMSLVSLGSCLFTITSAFAFISGPMNWDGSRVAAAIPSGVGFLGAGLIWKKSEVDGKGDSTHSVHGLTTAASVWLSAAVGIAAGGELYFAAMFSVAIMMLMLRFGPRTVEQDQNPGPTLHNSYHSTNNLADEVFVLDEADLEESQSLLSSSTTRAVNRLTRPSLME